MISLRKMFRRTPKESQPEEKEEEVESIRLTRNQQKILRALNKHSEMATVSVAVKTSMSISQVYGELEVLNEMALVKKGKPSENIAKQIFYISTKGRNQLEPRQQRGSRSELRF